MFCSMFCAETCTYLLESTVSMATVSTENRSAVRLMVFWTVDNLLSIKMAKRTEYTTHKHPNSLAYAFHAVRWSEEWINAAQTLQRWTCTQLGRIHSCRISYLTRSALSIEWAFDLFVHYYYDWGNLLLSNSWTMCYRRLKLETKLLNLISWIEMES